MGIVERIKDLQQAKRELGGVVPSSKLQEVLAKSGVETSVKKLSELTEVRVRKELIEGGKKMVIVIKWPTQDKRIQNQLVVSAREDSLSFMGDSQSNQYLRMEGQEMFDRELAEEYLARTFVNPSRIKTEPQN